MDTNKEADDVTKGLQWVAENFLASKDTTEGIAMYDKCWSTYEELTVTFKWKAAKVAAEAVVRYASDKKDFPLLDVAAGSGLVAEELKSHGFTNMDALDASVGMLNAARQKNQYRNYIQEFFPCDKPSVKTSSYDILVNCGGISGGHMKCDCLPEQVRCVKPGGLVVMTFSEMSLTTVVEYKDRLEPLMKQLETEGKWKMLERIVVPNIWHTYNGLLFVFRVTKEDN